MDKNKTKVTIVKATLEDKPVVANLLQLYLYDMTADMPFPIGRDGKFEYDFFERFWLHPYLIFEGEDLAGFALVIDDCPITDTANCHFMAEFFVLKAYRGKGVGRAAVDKILRQHDGLWHICVIDKNQNANAFWTKTLAAHDTKVMPHCFDGENWLVNEFTLRR